MKIPEYAREVIERLEKSGFSAYFVGGCVRDSLLLSVPGDYDITTSATPEEIKAVFSDCRTVDTGIRHGTVTVLYEDMSFEITTYRSDGRYTDHRKPDDVHFSKNIADDLSRRDFTVNAIAYSEKEGYIDLFSGREDIENKIIRSVGAPECRFEEDALRILRALRFAARLGFEIEEKTGLAIREKYPLLRFVSRERIFSELSLLITHQYAGRILREYREVFAFIIPELAGIFDLDQKNPHHIYDVFEHTVRVLEASPGETALRFAALFHDIGKASVMTLDANGVGHFYGHPAVSADIAERALRSLKAPAALIKRVRRIVEVHDIRPAANERSMHKFLIKNGDVLLSDYIAVRLADLWAQNPEYHYQREEIYALERIAKTLIENGAPIRVAELDISGEDILKLGISGASVGRLLSKLLLDVADKNVKNERASLIKRAERLSQNKEYRQQNSKEQIIKNR